MSMFPQSIGLAASWDTDLIYRVARAIGSEARSTGIHACFSPVLDIGKDPRWGRVQGSSLVILTLDLSSYRALQRLGVRILC
jgi:beta-glucosidase-like glycosyl hydrolase